MIDVGDLSSLQEIDLQLDVVQDALREVEARLGGNSLLPALEAEAQAQAQLLDAARQERISVETTGDDARSKIEAEDAKLYGGTIKDPRELRNLQEEIFALRRTLKAQEDDLLTRIEEEEGADVAGAHVQGLVKATTVAWEAEQQELEKRRAELTTEAAGVQAEIKTHRAEIQPEGLAVYDSQRRIMPVAIARVQGGACSGCRLTLPIYAINRARRGQAAVRCPSCQRILYVA